MLVVQPELLHFETPETSGGFFHGHVSLQGASKSPKYEYGGSNTTDFFGYTSTASQNEKVTPANNVGFSFNLGILDKIDYFMRNTQVLGLKFQFIGSSRREPTAGWKMSISAAKGSYASIQSTGTFGMFIFPFANKDSALESQGNSFDIAVNTGYRYNKNYLNYINIYRNKTNVTGSYTSDTTTFTKKRSQHTEGIILGFNYTPDERNVFITAEIGFAKSTWSTLGSKVYTPSGISVGYMW